MTTILTDNPDNFTSTTALEAVYGLGGNDTLTASSGGNLLAGGSGADKLYGGNGADTIFGDDSVGGNSRNVLYGKGGSDAIYSYSGKDAIYGGSGSDTVTAFAADALQSVDGGDGTDQLVLLAYANTAASLTLVMGASVVAVANGTAAATYLNFETLNVTGGSGGNFITGGDGNDTLNNTLNNVLFFTAGMLDGGGGDDRLAVYGFTDVAKSVETVSGGAGNDTLAWANGLGAGYALTVNGNNGTMSADGQVFLSFSQIETLQFQTYAGYSGALQYTGISGVDSVDVYAPSAVVKLGDGNDLATIESGASTVSGGGGNDMLAVSSANGASFAFSGDGGNDRLFGGSGTGSLSGAGGADSLYGGLGQTTLDGGDGADYLWASNGMGQLFGGAGKDALFVTAGFFDNSAAAIDGGDDRDSLTLDLSVRAVIFTANLSSANFKLDDGTTVKNCEAINFISGTGDDRLIASNDVAGAQANILSGGAGNDRLTASANGALLDGGDGTDTLFGADGADSLSGGGGDDSLNGGLGKDKLNGGSGLDRMTGGGDADQFYFAAASDTTTALSTCDRILDFSQSDKDRVDLHDLAGSVSGGTGLVFIAAKGFSGAAGELRYLQFDESGTSKDHTEILCDLNGDAVADLMVDASGLIAFKAGDFILV